MKLKILIILCAFLLLLSGCNTKYQRISFNAQYVAEELAAHISEDTTIINKTDTTFAARLPIYKITEDNITEAQFQQLKQQLQVPENSSVMLPLRYEGNCIEGRFDYYGDEAFTMSEEELEALAWKVFEKIPFMEGEYEYSGIRGERYTSNVQGDKTINEVMVSFYRLLDGVRVIGNDQCNMWFDDSGLVEIYIERFNYTRIGTMDLVPLEDAEARIDAPDYFAIDAPAGKANTLQVDRVRLSLVNQYSSSCTILQPIYSFVGTATFDDNSQAEFISRIIAIPESYTYEKETTE